MVRRQLHREPRAWPQSHDAHVGASHQEAIAHPAGPALDPDETFAWTTERAPGPNPTTPTPRQHELSLEALSEVKPLRTLPSKHPNASTPMRITASTSDERLRARRKPWATAPCGAHARRPLCAWTNVFAWFGISFEIHSCVCHCLMHRYIHDVEVDVK